MTPQQAIEIITNAVQGDGTKLTAEQDEALAIAQKAMSKEISNYKERTLSNDIYS